MRLKRLLIQGVLGIVVLFAIYLKIRDYGFSGNVSYQFLFLSVLSYIILNLILAFRLKKVVEKTGCSVRYMESVQAHFGGMLLSDFTPGRSGYLTTPFFLRKIGSCELNQGMAGILVPQAIEFLIKIFGGALGLFFLFSSADKFKELLAISTIAMGTLLILSFLIIAGSWFTFGSKIPLPGFIKKYLGKYTTHSVKTKESLNLILVVSIAGWIITALQWYLVGLSLSIGLSFHYYFFLQPLVTILMFVPLTPAGLGIMEGGAVAALYLLGVEPSTAFFYSVLVRLSTVMGDMPGIFTIVRFPLMIANSETQFKKE
jgi:hypothetical protein